MNAFVTGATGFLGSHVARVLAEQGADLRLLVRSTSNLKNLEGLKAGSSRVETATGDLRDPASLEKAMAGCDTVFHVAADYRLWVRDPAEMYRSNVEGTRAILEAALKNGVRSVVYTSSVATMGFTGNGRPADEDSPVALADMIGHYKRSKFMAEQVALQAGRGGMRVVTVNPTTPVGEQDVKPTPTGRIVVDYGDREETIVGGQAYYVAPGHKLTFEADCEALEFTPTEALQQTLDAARASHEAGAPEA